MVEQKPNSKQRRPAISEYFTPGLIVSIVFALLFAIISSTDGFRSRLSSWFLPEQKVLGKISFQIADRAFVAYKFHRLNSIQVEIFEASSENGERLLQNFTFEGDENALLEVKDVPVALGVSEGSTSGEFELFVPTVDRFGGSRLNIFRYDAALNQFMQISPE